MAQGQFPDRHPMTHDERGRFSEGKTALGFSKKPRRVRARRREKNKIRFPRRHVRRGKHFSAEQCASWPPQADSECAHEAAASPVGKGFAFFDGLRAVFRKENRPLARLCQRSTAPQSFFRVSRILLTSSSASSLVRERSSARRIRLKATDFLPSPRPLPR